MRVQQITLNAFYGKTTNFKGYFAQYQSYPVEVEGASSRHGHSITTPNGHSRFVDYNRSYYSEPSDSNYIALRHFSNHDDPNCYIEFIKKPQNKYGVDLKEYQVYYADPQEGITDAIKAKANYIVYDPEPSYPHIDKEVSKAYFNGVGEDYSEHYKTVKSYFKRLESVDTKTLNEIRNRNDLPDKASKIEYYQGRIKDAIAQQKNAEDCMNIFEESKRLREEIMFLFFEHRSSLEKLKSMSYEIENFPLYYNTEKEFLEKKQIFQEYENKFEILKNKIAEKQAEITPYFEKLKNLYKTRGIKVIKRI